MRTSMWERTVRAGWHSTDWVDEMNSEHSSTVDVISLTSDEWHRVVPTGERSSMGGVSPGETGNGWDGGGNRVISRDV